MPVNETVDDQDIAVLYSGPWHFYRGPTNVYNASQWTYAALYGDSSGSHGVFSCRLESKTDGQSEPEGLWSWYDGGSLWWWPYQHNVTLCAVSAPWNDEHTLVLSVEPDQVRQGIAFDFGISSQSVPPGPVQWMSDFTNAVPPQSLRNTTATPILPSSTAYYAAAPSATDAATWAYDDSQSLRIGLGVGLGLGIPLGLCAALALWWHFRRRRRRIEGGIPYRKQGGTFEVQSVRHSKGGTPNMPNQEAEFGTDTLVEAGPEKEGARWYGRPGGAEGTYESGSVPASPGQYSPSSLDFALPSVPDSNRRLSYGSPASPQTGYPPGPLSGASPQRPRWSVTSGSEAPSDLRATRTRETFDLTADTELDDPNTFRER
ncbi:hypothetical protein RHOSPDRAFT_31197 [Rhodotorula sp. JG-1b]|nr:hypothetical protein RHOSPDRAFT_31197 [Rhodotorula sp. JG-1b]